jgi:ABC-2 type transport system ATP-binding protein
MIVVDKVSKQYSTQKAVDNISLSISKGEIFGLLGPNGAGKSSLLRMITGITKPDSGKILFNGEAFNEQTHNPLIGYMPEERGLYKKMKVGEHALYLAQLKGVSKSDALNGVRYWMHKLNMDTWWNKKVEDLSKGMSQKLQFVVTVLHKPQLLILDEPFSGLDPVNAEVLKKEIYELAHNGTTIIFSTHRMEQVEEICNNIVLMHKGASILAGNVADIKQQYKQHIYELTLQQALPQGLPINILQHSGNTYTLSLSAGFSSNQLLQACIQHNNTILNFHEVLPSLNDIFINLVQDTAARSFDN